jgi:hypothetical protein
MLVAGCSMLNTGYRIIVAHFSIFDLGCGERFGL